MNISNESNFNPEVLSFYSNENGVQIAVDGFLIMRELTLGELNNTFTREELIGMVNSFNGINRPLNKVISPRNVLYWSMQDSIELEKNDTMYNYNGDELLAKIDKMTDIQAFYLMEEIHRFWNQSGNLDFEKFFQLDQSPNSNENSN